MPLEKPTQTALGLPQRDYDILGETLSDAMRRIRNACFDDRYQNLVNKVANSSTGASRFADRVNNRQVVPGTPILLNMGAPSLALASCTARAVSCDWSASALLKDCLHAHRHGIGVGFDLDKLQDPVGFLNESNRVFLRQHSQENLKRPVGDSASLYWNHPDIAAFVEIKNSDPSQKWLANFSVKLDQAFFDKVKTCGKTSRLLDRIAYSAWLTGDPGVIFSDRLNKKELPGNPYTTVAPCGETGLMDGDLCHFAYVNLNAFFKKNREIDFRRLRSAVHDTVDFLDYCLCWTSFQSGYQYKLDMLSERKRIAVGICGYSDALHKTNTNYGSHRALVLAETLMAAVNLFSKERSAQLAKCPSDQDIGPTYAPKNTRLGLGIRSGLVRKASTFVKANRTKHSTTTAIPPSGRAARVIGASPSLEAYAPGAPNTISIVPVLDQLNTTNAFLKYVDESVSKTVHLKNSATVTDAKNVITAAWKSGLKSISIYRDGCRHDQPFPMCVT
ncbi:MAG: hypothetical protein AAF358_09345 [Pseudomonadota bacterium]